MNETECHFVPFSKWLCTFRGRVNSHSFQCKTFHYQFSFPEWIPNICKRFRVSIHQFHSQIAWPLEKNNPWIFCKCSKALSLFWNFLICKVRKLINPARYFNCSTNIRYQFIVSYSLKVFKYSLIQISVLMENLSLVKWFFLYFFWSRGTHLHIYLYKRSIGISALMISNPSTRKLLYFPFFKKKLSLKSWMKFSVFFSIDLTGNFHDWNQ